MTNKPMQEDSEVDQDTGNLLSPEERVGCQQLTAGEAPHNQRAQALLTLDEGATQEAAGQRAGLTKGQVRYWLGKFRKTRMAIFPEAPHTPAEPQPEPAPLASEPTATAEETIVDPAIAVKEVQPEVVTSAAALVVTKKASKKKQASQKKPKKAKKPKKGTKRKSKKKKKSQKVKSGKKKKAKKAAGQKKNKKKKGSKKQAGKKAKKKDK